MSLSSATEAATEPREIRLLAKAGGPGGSVEPPQPRKLSVKNLMLAIVALAAVALTFAHYRSSAASISDGGKTVAAATQDFVTTLRLTGTTGAKRARSVMVPTLEGAALNSLVVTKLAPAGVHVKQGDLLVEFDQQAQIKDYLDKKATYMDLVAQAAVKRAAEDSARAQDETALKQAQDDLTKAQLEVSKNELVSRIDAEKNQETLDEAQSTLKQLEETFKLKRQAAEADIHTLEIQRDRAMATMNYAQSNAQKMTIRSSMDGITVLNTIWLGGRMGEVQEGDQVRAGVPFMQVVDPSEMLVNANVNEADLLKLKEGQTARVSFDAYPGMTFPATLTELSPLGRTGEFSDKVRTFAATFAIQGSNPKLMPDLSAAVDIELEGVKNATVIPLQSIGHEKAGDYVWLKSGVGFEKRQVKLGPRNDLEAVVQSGLKPGDEIREQALEGAAATAEANTAP